MAQLPVSYAVGLVVAAGVTLGLLALQRRSFHHWTGVGLVPWMVAGGLAVALASTPTYPAALTPLFGPVAVYLTVGTTAGLLWFPFRHVTLDEGTREAPELLAASGAGASLSLVGVLAAVRTGGGSPTAWLIGAPLAAGALALVGYLAYDRVDPFALGQTRMLGLVVLFAHALAGVVAAVVVDGGGRPAGTYARVLLSLAGSGPTASMAVLVGGHLLVGFVAVSAAGRVVSRDEAVGHLLSTAAAAVGVGPAVAALVRVTLM